MRDIHVDILMNFSEVNGTAMETGSGYIPAEVYRKEIMTAAIICGLSVFACAMIVVGCLFIYKQESKKPLLSRDMQRYKTKGVSRSQSTSYHNTSVEVTVYTQDNL